jgi:hypothetical protein
MRPLHAFALGVALTLAALYAFDRARQPSGDDLARAEAARDSIATVADSLRAEAERADTVLLTLTDTVRVVVERVRERAAVAVDSLMARVDSTEALYVAEILQAHAEEVAALTALSDQRLAWGTAWRDAALEYAAGWEAERAVGAELRLALAASERARRRQSLEVWAYRIGGAVGVGYAGVRAVTGG